MSRQIRRRWLWTLLCVLAVIGLKVGLEVGSDGTVKTAKADELRSDMNADGVVDLKDVKIFSDEYLEKDWDEVDWCAWLKYPWYYDDDMDEDEDEEDKEEGEKEGKKGKERKEDDGEEDEEDVVDLSELLAFIAEYFNCDQTPPTEPPSDPLAVVNANNHPVRVAWGPSGKLYVTDSEVGSVFIYDSSFIVVGEIKNLSNPLGVVVDSAGNIYVGLDGSDMVEVYAPDGVKFSQFGKGLIRMPNDLALDNEGRVYVADSKSDTVWIFGANGGVIKGLSSTENDEMKFDFPAAVEVGYYLDAGTGLEVGELYVVDQGNYLIKVFDLDANYLRSFGGEVRKGGMMGTTWYWKGKFVKAQSLIVDALGRVHVADSYMNNVQILDGETGAFIDSYGVAGNGRRQIDAPLDIAINALAQVAVANYGNARAEIIYTMP